MVDENENETIIPEEHIGFEGEGRELPHIRLRYQDSFISFEIETSDHNFGRAFNSSLFYYNRFKRSKKKQNKDRSIG